MIDLNAAIAEELDGIPELKGREFELVRYPRSGVEFMPFASVTRYRAFPENGKELRSS